MAYGDLKDLPRRTVVDKALCDKAFNIAKNKTFYGYQHRIASMVYIYIFLKKRFLVVVLPRINWRTRQTNY